MWIFFPSQGSTDGTPDRTLVYHMVSGQWGRADMTVEAAVTFIQPGITYATLDTVALTFDDLPDVSYDSAYWISGSRALAVFDSVHQMQTLTGQASFSEATLWDIGSDSVVTHMDGVTLTFGVPVAVARVSGYTRQVSGGVVTKAGNDTLLSDGKFKVRQSGRWHVLSFVFVAGVLITGVDYSLKPVGLR